MSFYQNPFDQEFRGHILLGGERNLAINFVVPANRNRSDLMESGNVEPYDLSTYNTLTINYAYDVNLVNYSALAINVAGAVTSATLASEIVAALNSNTTFTDLFSAQVKNAYSGGLAQPPVNYVSGAVPTASPPNKVLIVGKRNKSQMRTWITNSGAEQKLRFNLWAGVAELPTYFDRHTIANRLNYPGSEGMLVKLDQTDATVDQPIITAAGLVPANMQTDWQLLKGRTITFIFQKNTLDSALRLSFQIEYPAGAKAGDLARKKHWTYTSTNVNADTYTEIPYVLQAADLISNP